MAPGGSRFSLQGAINRWVSVNQQSNAYQTREVQDDVSIRNGDAASVTRKSYPRKPQPQLQQSKKKQEEPVKIAAGSSSKGQDDATTVCSSSTLGTASQHQAKQLQVPLVAGASWAATDQPMVHLPSGSFDHGSVKTRIITDRLTDHHDDDVSRASSKRQRTVVSAPGFGDAHSVASSIASAPIPGAIAAARLRYTQPTPPPAAVSPGVFYGVDYSQHSNGVSPAVTPGPLPVHVPSGAASVASVSSQRSRSSIRSAPVASGASCALPVGVPLPSSGPASALPPPLPGPPPTGLFHPMCPGAPPVVNGSIVVTEKRPPPPAAPYMLVSHNHASGSASLPGSVLNAESRRSKGRKSSTNSKRNRARQRKASSSNNTPVMLEFRDWTMDRNVPLPPPVTGDSPSPPPPNPSVVFGVCPPLHVSVPSGSGLTHTQQQQPNPAPTSPPMVRPVAPPPAPGVLSPGGSRLLPPKNPSSNMVHFVHSDSNSSNPPLAPDLQSSSAAVINGQGQQGMADLQAKMEAALVLTSLPLAPATAPTTSAQLGVPATTVTSQSSGDAINRTASSSDDNGGGISSDGYEGSGEEDGNREVTDMDVSTDVPPAAGATAPVPPRRLLKGGKRGKVRSSSPSSSLWGNKAKNMADSALEEYRTLEQQQQEAQQQDGKGIKPKSRFRGLKRTNSKKSVFPPPPAQL